MKYVLPLLITIVLSALAGAFIAGQSDAQEIVVPDVPSVIQGVTTDKQGYDLGETVNISFVVQNRTQQPVTYKFSSGKQFDVWVMRGPREVWRLSKHSSYIQTRTQLTLQPGEIRTWTVKWDQFNNEGEAVAPCGYDVFGQLTPTGQAFLPVKSSIAISVCAGIAILPITIEEGIRRFTVLQNQRVSINATFHGSQPDGNGKNCRQGPPVSRSDWAISDDTGCMYVTGGTLGLDLNADIGKKVNVVGNLKKTDKGQVYLEFVSGTVK